MIAAGAYIRTLREKRKLTRKVVAERAKTSVSQLFRIEAGQQETRGSLLMDIISAVQGDPDQVAELLASPTATAEDGRKLAETLNRVIDEEGARPYLQTADDTAELMRYIEEEITNTYEEDRRSLGDALRVFLAGFRAARRRNDE